jgi:L-fuculose-phosphate aldolase
MPQLLTDIDQVDELQVEKAQRRAICKLGRQMYRRGFIVACEGNLSVRLNAHRILITPAGVCKGHMAPEDLTITDLTGAVTRGTGNPSSEIQMHLLCYRLRADVVAVCHAHPATATGFAAAGRALKHAVLPEMVMCLGEVPLAPYGTPGTFELCAGLEPLVTKHDAILLENHGVVTCGPDLVTAYQRMEMVEHSARILLTAGLLGGPNLLPPGEVQKLTSMRSQSLPR